MVGGGYDGNEYGQPGNENSILDPRQHGSRVRAVQIKHRPPEGHEEARRREDRGRRLQHLGVVDTRPRRTCRSSRSPRWGSRRWYTNTTVEFGTTDVGPVVLGMKNAGADGVYLPMVGASELRGRAGRQQNGLAMKAAVLATGYGQDLLDQPRRPDSAPRS